MRRDSRRNKMDVYELIKAPIVIVSIATSLLEIKKIRKLGFHWVTFSVVVIGFYWAGYYTYSILRAIHGWSFTEHQVFVRSGILLSMVVFLAKAIRMNRRINNA